MRILILIASLAFVVGCQPSFYPVSTGDNSAKIVAKERSKDRNPKSSGDSSGSGSSY